MNIGSAFGRLMEELIRPLVIRTLDILKKKELIPADLDIKNIDDYFIKIDITSPIAQQQSFEDVQTMVNTVAMIAQFSPELAASVFKMEDLSEFIGNEGGVPAKFIRDADERQQNQAEQQRGAEAAEDAQLAKTTQAKVIEKNAGK